jgi:hypothetical protein
MKGPESGRLRFPGCVPEYWNQFTSIPNGVDIEHRMGRTRGPRRGWGKRPRLVFGLPPAFNANARKLEKHARMMGQRFASSLPIRLNLRAFLQFLCISVPKESCWRPGWLSPGKGLHQRHLVLYVIISIGGYFGIICKLLIGARWPFFRRTEQQAGS